MSELTLSEKKKEDWMNTKWRPMMGWMYMLVCTMDFVLFPILWSLIQVAGGGRVETQWAPITLQGAGLFHMAMGAVLGVAAFGRTQEKLAGANNGGAIQPANSFGPATPPSTGFGQTSTSFGGNSFGGVSNPTTSGKSKVPVGDEPVL